MLSTEPLILPFLATVHFLKWVDDLDSLDEATYALVGIAAGLTLRQIDKMRSDNNVDP